MADPVILPTNKPFFVIDLSGQNSNPMIPDSYISNHFKDKIQSTKLKLTSDASDTIWEVELDGGRFVKGWNDFSVSHCVRDDDVLSFRHDGDMIFHVTPLGRTFSPVQLISSTSDDDDDEQHDIFYDDDDDDYENNIFNDDDDDGEDENWTLEEDLYPKKSSSSKKRSTTETESSYLVAHVTHASLRRDLMCVSKKFTNLNGLNMRKCEIDLIDEHEKKSWTMRLSYNKTTGQAFINGGWRSFCRGNGIKPNTFCRFKLVQNGTKPVLRLCPNISSNLVPQGNSSKAKEIQNVFVSEGDDGIESEEFSESALMNQSRIVTLDFKPYMFRSSQLRLPPSFSKANGIEEAGEITLVGRDGTVWKSHLVNVKGREQFYISGCRALFAANGISKPSDSFTLEVIRGGTSPILKFCPKVKEASLSGYKTPSRKMARASGAEETETRVEKRARVSSEGGGSSRRTRASNNSNADDDQGTLQCKQQVQPCSISDQVTKVKQSIVETLTSVRQFRSELEIKERNLEVSLLEIDALEEKIMGISKIFNVNQV